MTFKILQGDNRDTLKTIPDNSIDAIVTDPPYGIDFLGKSWDANTGALETYQECLRVLKPGGHILAFSAARTYHHLAVTLEQAGFEIRDQIMWIYSSGFPKSQDIGRSIQRSLGVKETKKRKTNEFSIGGRGEHVTQQSSEQIVCTDPEAKKWEGWGTALKPAHEPICLARKPVKTSIVKNVQQWGTGALNIDAARMPTDQPPKAQIGPVYGAAIGGSDPFDIRDKHQQYEPNEQGRFPSNVIGEIAEPYQRYFYCPKVSRAERHCGFDTESIPADPSGKYDRTNDPGNANERIERRGIVNHWDMLEAMGGYYIDENGNKDNQRCAGGKNIYLPHKGQIYGHGLNHEYAEWCRANNIATGNVGNNHPTVKPVALMEYLIKLITPPGGHVLDPFNGSGSTGMAAAGRGFDYTGCELDPAYVEISKQRIRAWLDQKGDTELFRDLFDYE